MSAEGGWWASCRVQHARCKSCQHKAYRVTQWTPKELHPEGPASQIPEFWLLALLSGFLHRSLKRSICCQVLSHFSCPKLNCYLSPWGTDWPSQQGGLLSLLGALCSSHLTGAGSVTGAAAASRPAALRWGTQHPPAAPHLGLCRPSAPSHCHQRQ